MRVVDLIVKKRDGLELTREEIEFLIAGFARDEVPDYQMSAWAMAVLLRGMSEAETLDLTLAMAASGEQLDLRGVVDLAVDKHSTGGVGDKTTLVVQPMVAACGLPVGKMSGRGLGFSGGTLDKMESIPGFRVDLSREEFMAQLKDIGLVLAGQTADLAPADGKLYSLRDVTGTVPSIPLIASSVMSKKLAGGAQGIVLDVKAGVGAFMATVDEAAELARRMVAIGRGAGRKVVALISDMNQPLGHAVGNSLEVREALETLRGGGPEDFREHCLEIAAHMLVLGGRAADLKGARQAALGAVDEGRALEKFRALVRAQGGDTRYIDEVERFPQAGVVRTIPSPRAGYLARIDARVVGETVVALGGGRARKGEPINHAVGLAIHHKVGDQVEQDEALFTVHAASPQDADLACERVLAGHGFSSTPVEPLPLFYRTVDS